MSDKREQLLEASIDLFAKEGFWNTPTARIAKHAKVATGTLFNYFPSKEELIDEVYIQLKQELFEALKTGLPVEADGKTCFRHIWFGYIKWGVANPKRFLLLEQLRLSDLVSQEARGQIDQEAAFMTDLLSAGIENKVFRDVPEDYLVTVILANVESSVKYAIASGMNENELATFCENGFEMLWKCISVD